MHQIQEDYRQAHISEKECVMLDYVAKLTLAPWTVERGDVEKLKSAGFSDARIVHINQIASYYASTNRQILGLGIEVSNSLAPDSPSKVDQA